MSDERRIPAASLPPEIAVGELTGEGRIFTWRCPTCDALIRWRTPAPEPYIETRQVFGLMDEVWKHARDPRCRDWRYVAPDWRG